MTMCLHTAFVCCVRFCYTSERLLSLLNLPCEVAVLISCSQTCFVFFPSQHITGRSTLLALESTPHHGLCPHASTGAHMLHMVDELQKTHLL